MKTVVEDLTTSRKIDHVHYVALSRATSIERLYILNLQPDKISINPQVKEDVKRLRQEQPVHISPSLFDISPENKICFFNARSLHRHLLDVRQDFTLQLCSIICCCETRLIKTDTEQDTQLAGFHQYRQDDPQISQRRPAYGIVLYSKSLLNPVTLVFVYRPPAKDINNNTKSESSRLQLHTYW